MARGFGRRIRGVLTTVVAFAIALVGMGSATDAAASVGITVSPALHPSFNPTVTDYVTRCEPSERVRISVSDSNGIPVSVDQQATHARSFSTRIQLVAGQRFTLRIGSGAQAANYKVRCLPYDFPAFAVKLAGHPQAAYYLLTLGSAMTMTPLPYVVLFNSQGVPVWWYQELDGVPTQASLLPNGDLAWEVNIGAVTLGSPPTIQWEEHRLNGTLVRTLQTGTTLRDSPEAQLLPNGDFLTTSYTVQSTPLSSIGVVGSAPVFDATFAEIRPDGSSVYTWDSNGKLSLPESERWWFAWQVVPGSRASTLAWDAQHITSLEPDGDGFLVAMDHTDAVYLIRRSDGSIEWKLGGTPTPQSLTILGDPHAATDFGGPHDAQVLPDGTISIHDNATFRNVVVPRVLRFRIDTDARTATLVQALTDPSVTSSTCCGSARLLPGGDWVVDWGGTQIMDELAPDGTPVLRLTLAAPYYSYRAAPILPGQIDPASVVSGMDEMYPRSHPSDRGWPRPLISALRIAPATFVLAGRRVERGCVPVTSGNRGHTPCSRPISLQVHLQTTRRAVVRFTIERCISSAAAKSRHPTCTRVVTRGGSLTRTAAGPTQFALRALIGGRRLGPGLYRLTATPTVGNRIGQARTAEFRLLG